MQAQALLDARALAARLSERMTLVSALHRRLEKSSLLQPHGEQAPTAQSSRAQTSSPPAPAKAKAKKERRPSALESAALEQLQRSQYSKAGSAVQAYEGFDPIRPRARHAGLVKTFGSERLHLPGTVQLPRRGENLRRAVLVAFLVG